MLVCAPHHTSASALDATSSVPLDCKAYNAVCRPFKQAVTYVAVENQAGLQCQWPHADSC